MAVSVFNSILSTVQTQIAALGLALNTYTIPVVVRKLPKAQETLDGPLPILTVTPAEKPELITQASAETQVFVEYFIEVVMIAAGNRDFFTNLDNYLSWRQTIRRLYQQNPGSVGIQTVFDSDVLPEWVLNRQLTNSDYDYSGLMIRFRSIENRTN